MRHPSTPAVAPATAPARPLGLGLMPASGLSLMRAVDRDMVAMAISRATAAFVVVTRRNPLWALAAGTMANIITLHL